MIRKPSIAFCFSKSLCPYYTGWITFLVCIFQAVGAMAQAPNISYATPQVYATNNAISNLSPSNSGGSVPALTFRNVTTYAGSGADGNTPTNSTNPLLATFKDIVSMVVDAKGNIYVAESGNGRIRKIAANGAVTMLMDLDGTNYNPKGMAINSSTGDLYFSVGQHAIYRIPNTNSANYPGQDPTYTGPTDATVSTYLMAGLRGTSGNTNNSTGTSARFNIPLGMDVDASNGFLYLVEYGSSLIRKISLTSPYAVTTVTTSGVSISQPEDLVVDAAGVLFVTSAGANVVYRVGTDGVVTTFAGSGTAGYLDGQGTSARLSDPRGIDMDAAGNLYVADGSGAHSIRKITSAGYVSTLAGSGTGLSGTSEGVGTSARFDVPWEVIVDRTNSLLYVGDNTNNKVREVEIGGYTVWPSLTEGLSISATTGVISGTPTVRSRQVYYADDFDDAAGGTGTTIAGHAAYLGGWMRLTDAVNSQDGAFKVDASGVNTNGLQVDFKFITGKTSGGADGMSYSFSSDAVTTGGSSVQLGTGSGLSLSFVTYSSNTIKMNLYYGSGRTNSTTVTGTLLASNTSSNALWLGRTANISLTIDNDGKVTVKVEGTTVFNQVQLPAGYAAADKSTWYHVFRAVTGGFNDVHAIDDLVIRQSLGAADHTVTGYNATGRSASTVNINVADLPTISTTAISSITTSSASSGGSGITDGGSPVTAKGVVWSTSSSPTVTLTTKTNDGTGAGSFTSSLTGLADGMTYYVRAYATTAAGTTYGSELSFTTLQVAPNISYASASYTLGKGNAITPITLNNAGGTPDKVLVSTLYDLKSNIAPQLTGLSLDGSGNIYFTAWTGHKIFKLNLSTGVTTTIAGAGWGYQDGPLSSALFNYPYDIHVESDGRILVSDANNSAIRRIDLSASTVSTVVGNNGVGWTDGAVGTAKIFSPANIMTDATGSIYFSDRGNYRIRKISGGVVSTISGPVTSVSPEYGHVDGSASSARYNSPDGIVYDPATAAFYIADAYNNAIRKITSAGVVSTFAGADPTVSSINKYGFINGTGTTARFNRIAGMKLDGRGNLLVADMNNNAIRKVVLSSGVVSTMAFGNGATSNDGHVSTASAYGPNDIDMDTEGNFYVAENYGKKIRIISGYSISPTLPAGLYFDPRNGTISGTPTSAQAAKQYTVSCQNAMGTSTTTITLSIAGPPTVTTTAPTSITSTGATLNGTVNANGGNTSGLTIKYSASQADVDAGNGTSATVSPVSVSGNTVTAVSAAITGLTASTTYYFRVSATNVAGTTNGSTLSFKTSAPPPNISYSGSPITLSVGSAMTTMSPVNIGGTPEPMQVSTLAGQSTPGFADGTGSAAKFSYSGGLVVDASGNVFVADNANHRIRKITPEGVVTTIAGSATRGTLDGTGNAASFNQPIDLVLDASNNIYVSDLYTGLLRKITPLADVTTIAGAGTLGFQDGTGASARFYYPKGLVINSSGNILMADYQNHRIRSITPLGVVTTFAGNGTAKSIDGTGTSANLNHPQGLAIDASGNLYVSELWGHLIRKIEPSGVVTTIAGNGTKTSSDGTGTGASFNGPGGIAIDAAGNLFVAERFGNFIRKITPSGIVTTLAGNGTSSFVDGVGKAAGFTEASGLAIDAQGNLYLTDKTRVRKITKYSISPALPAGLSFNTATGEISGTPTAISPATTYTVKASNTGGASPDATFTLSVISSMMTTDVSAIGETTATTGGTVGSGFSGITERGVVWGTTTAPTTSGNKLADLSATTGVFNLNLTGLTANTTYYIRAYVVHSGGTTYGSEKSFKTNNLGAFTDISKTFGDPKFSLTAPTAVSTGAFSFASSNTGVATVTPTGEVTIAGAGATTITATQAASGAYAEATKTLTLTVNKGTPTITLTVPTTTPLNQVTGANTINVSGTSSDGQAVIMSIVSGGASGTLTATATPGQYTLSNVGSSGIITFEGSVSGNTNMNTATKQAAMDVTLIGQSITFNPSTPLTYSSGMSLSLSATGGGSGIPVTFSVVSGPANNGGTNGAAPTVTGPGTIVVKASQVGNGAYNAAPDVSKSIVVTAATPVVSSFTPTSATEGDVVTITGQHFQNVSAVSFGGTAVTSFTVVNANTITAVVGTGSSGSVSVTTTGGSDSKAGFRYKVTWTGATNAFNSTGNWSGGRVPQTDDDIIFSPTAASDLELDGNKTVGHVNFNGSGRSLKLGAHNLTIKGNLTMPGNISGTGRVIMNGSAAQTIIGGGDIPDLEINNSTGVTIDGSGDELTVSGTLRSTSGTLTTNGKLRLKSNSSGTARVGQVTGAITGNVIAERYVQRNNNSDGTGRAWRLVSVPVTGTGTLRDFFMNGRSGQDLTLSASRDAETDNSGTPIVGHNYATASEATSAGFDWIGVANSVSSLRYYTGDAAGGSFVSENVPTMTTDYANAAQGYMVFTRGDRKLDFPSATSSGATTFRSTGSLKTGNQTVSIAPASTSKFTLVGNPYMSVLDLSALYASNTSVIEPSFWIWDANIAGTNKQGGYVNVYKSGTQWVTNTGGYINPERIESGMAFFVEPKTTLSASATLTITESHKSSDASAGLSPFATDQSDDHGRLYVRMERADEKGQRQLIDGVMADFHKDFKETLGDMSDREKLRNAISRGALWLSTDQKILSSEGLPWPTETKRSIPLYMSGVGDQTLIVRVDPRGMRDRYVKAWLKDNVLKRQVEISMNAPTDYDFIGTSSAAWDSTRFEILYVEAGRPSTGVNLEPDDAAEQPSVKLYPNPSKSADVKLSLRAMAPGTYSVHVLDMTGRLVATTRLDHRSVNGEYRILEGRLLSPGTYIIKLSDQNKQPKETFRLVVEK